MTSYFFIIKPFNFKKWHFLLELNLVDNKDFSSLKEKSEIQILLQNFSGLLLSCIGSSQYKKERVET